MTLHRTLARAALAAAATLVVAAAGVGSLQAIEHGDTTSAEERARVVRFVKKMTTRHGTACTGTRVGALWALTAAHCVHPFVRTFGESGGRTTDAGATPVAVIVDPDERRLVVAGRDQAGVDSRAAVVWARDAHGARDTRFYGGLRVPLLFDDAGESEAHDLALLPDGGVVVVGRAVVAGEDQLLVAKVSAAGVVAVAPFAGAAALGFAPARPGVARAVVADDVGRVTVGGFWLDAGVPRAVLEAYDPDTSLAAGFTWDRRDTPGQIVDLVTIAGSDDVVALLVPPRGAAQLLRIDAQGHTVASLALGAVTRLGASAGAAFVYAAESGPDGLFVVQRASTSGGGLVRDLGFGAAGYARASFPHRVSLASMVVDETGRVTVGGATHGAELCGFGALARFTATGALDVSFGHGGLALLDDACRSTATIAALALLPAEGAAAADAPALVVAQALGRDASLALLAGDHRFTAPLELELEVAGARVPIAQVFRHPNPEVDVALVSLGEPVPGGDPGAGPTPAELVYTGGPDSLRGRTIVCTGFGTRGTDGVPTAVDVPLTRGGFELDAVDDHRLSLVTPSAQGLIPGDSGGPCWIDDPAGPRLVGVMERSLSGALAGSRRGWSDAAALHQIVRAAPLAAWIAAVAVE